MKEGIVNVIEMHMDPNFDTGDAVGVISRLALERATEICNLAIATRELAQAKRTIEIRDVQIVTLCQECDRLQGTALRLDGERYVAEKRRDELSQDLKLIEIRLGLFQEELEKDRPDGLHLDAIRYGLVRARDPRHQVKFGFFNAIEGCECNGCADWRKAQARRRRSTRKGTTSK